MTLKFSEVKDWVTQYVTGFVERNFFPRNRFKATRVAGRRHDPIVTNDDGYVDVTFLNGADHTELIADTVGAMVTGNTESGITVTYQDADNTLDFTVNPASIDHGALGGLTDDDHTQYVLANGTRDIEGSTGQTIAVSDNVTSAISTALTLAHKITGTPAVNSGVGIAFQSERVDGFLQSRIGRIMVRLRQNSPASDDYWDMEFETRDNDTFVTSLRIRSDGLVQANQITADGATTQTAFGYDNARLGVISGTPRLILDSNTASQIWMIDTHSSGLRFFVPGSVKATLDTNGILTLSGINVGEDTLNVFDEGTWTPTITAATASPTYTATAAGSYLRENNWVHFQGTINISSWTSAGLGAYRFSLPIAAAAGRRQVAVAHWTDDSSLLERTCTLVIEGGNAYGQIASGVFLSPSLAPAADDIITYSGSYLI